MNRDNKIGFVLSRLLSFLLIPLVYLLLCGSFWLIVRADELVGLSRLLSDGFYDFKEAINIEEYGIDASELGKIFSFLMKNDPYLFFVDSNLYFSYRQDGCVVTVKPKYVMSREETELAWDFCRENVKLLANEAAEHTENDMERVLFLHDSICLRFSYDDSLKNDNMYMFLKSGRGTCQSYTLLYMAAVRELGLDCTYAASDTIAHIWNLIELDDSWYHVDLTWDDASEAGVSRRHFLLSDRLAKEKGHRDWYSGINLKCSNDSYSEFDFDSIHSVISCDADHSGGVELADILSIVTGNTVDGNKVCTLCADADLDGVLSDADEQIMRGAVFYAVRSRESE